MARRFTVIQGGLTEATAMWSRRRHLPGRAELEAVGAALRQRLSTLPRLKPAPRAGRTTPISDRAPIPAAAFLGVRPEGWARDAA